MAYIIYAFSIHSVLWQEVLQLDLVLHAKKNVSLTLLNLVPAVFVAVHALCFLCHVV